MKKNRIHFLKKSKVLNNLLVLISALLEMALFTEDVKEIKFYLKLLKQINDETEKFNKEFKKFIKQNEKQSFN